MSFSGPMTFSLIKYTAINAASITHRLPMMIVLIITSTKSAVAADAEHTNTRPVTFTPAIIGTSYTRYFSSNMPPKVVSALYDWAPPICFITPASMAPERKVLVLVQSSVMSSTPSRSVIIMTRSFVYRASMEISFFILRLFSGEFAYSAKLKLSAELSVSGAVSRAVISFSSLIFIKFAVLYNVSRFVSAE